MDDFFVFLQVSLKNLENDAHVRLICNIVWIAFYVEEVSPHILYQEGFVVGNASISLHLGYPLGVNDMNVSN